MKPQYLLRRYIIAGLLVWVPIVVTLWVMLFFVDLMDKTLELIPYTYRPDTLLGFHIPGLGIIFTAIIVFFTGMAVTNILGHKLVGLGERLVARIPFVNSIYSAVKQVLNTVFSPSGESFRKVLLVEYPRPGMWTIAFQTNSGFKQAEENLEQKLITVFIPTTPNPTSGFIFLVPVKDTIELNISVDEGLKMVISLGVMTPGHTTNINSTQPNNKAGEK